MASNVLGFMARIFGTGGWGVRSDGAGWTEGTSDRS